ncbi:MAG: hypothetical protein ACOYOA_15025 [Saprospiraceae bacterium]
MKKVLIFLMASVVLSGVSAQSDCKMFSQFKKGFKMQMTSYDKNDKVVSAVDQEVIEVGTENGDMTATCKITTDQKEVKGMPENFTSKIRCRNGNIVMSFRDLMGSKTSFDAIKGMEMKITGEDVQIPYNLTVGQTLPDNEMTMEMFMETKPLAKMTFTMKDRMVEKKETITTSAGTFDCYKITYKMSNTMGMGEENSYAMWMDKGLTIKTATTDKKGKSMGYTLMTKLEKP